ncbi:unnamed protein product [Echinostoma caproni]|uniref:Thioredoxin domain-containing protein n=1 Tax=Echinostoma caproni TaxID=27848 RepID=A0A183AEC2_9TREM|nr:unnamed protein product [Echinostoma caproni]
MAPDQSEVITQILENKSSPKAIIAGQTRQPNYAPWCPACRQFGPIWEDFSRTPNMGVQIAAIDVTESPVLSFLFFINRLPTIFHAKNGVYRQYDGSRTLDDLKTYVFENGYTTVTPVPWYFSPSSRHMQFFCHFMDLGLAITQTHQALVDAGYPFYLSLIMIAVGTVCVGLILGVNVDEDVDDDKSQQQTVDATGEHEDEATVRHRTADHDVLE